VKDIMAVLTMLCLSAAAFALGRLYQSKRDGCRNGCGGRVCGRSPERDQPAADGSAARLLISKE